MYVHRIQRAAEVLGIRVPKTGRSNLIKIIVAIVTIGSAGFNMGVANAASLTSASVALNDPRPLATASYTYTVSGVTASVVKCVKVTWSTSSSAVTTPTNFTAASATVTAASSTLINSSATGWTATPTANTVTYTNTTGVTPSTTTGATFIIAAVTNSSVVDTSYFSTLATFGNTDCSTTPIDNTLVKFINTNGSTLTLTVDPTLSFTVNAVASGAACDGTTTTAASTSTTIPFGSVTAASNGVVCQDLTAATNATNGYTIFARYTAAPTNGIGQTIADWTGTNGAPTTFSAAGTEAYGVTTNDATLSVTGNGANRFTNPSQNWSKLTTSNAELAYEAAGVNSTTYRIGHQVGIALTTKPGTYQTTVIYTCTPIY